MLHSLFLPARIFDLKKEHIKSFILILLILNSVQMTVQLWFESNLWPGGYDFLNSFSISKIIPFFGDNGDLTEEKMYLNATKPRRVIVNGGGAREVYVIDSEDYNNAVEIVQEVVATMKSQSVNVQKISYEQWKNLFKGKSLYVDYGYDFDSTNLNVLFDAKSSQGKFEQFVGSGGFILTPDVVTNTCTICFLDSDSGDVYEHKFTCDGKKLLSFVEEQTYGKHQNDTFAFEINLDTTSEQGEEVERMVGLSPLALLNISPQPVSGTQIKTQGIFKNADELERFSESTLPIFGYSPSSLRKTVQNNGTIVYVENNATIKYHFDGTVEYNAVSKEKGMKKSNTTPDCNQAVNDVLKVIKELWSKAELDNDFLNLHLDSPLIDNKNNKYTVKFNNIFNGVVVNYQNGGNNVVSAEVEDGYITKFVIHFTNISDTGSESQIMPVLSAIDKLYADHGTSKMIIDDVYTCYDIKQNSGIDVGWAFKVRGTNEILVVMNDDSM